MCTGEGQLPLMYTDSNTEYEQTTMNNEYTSIVTVHTKQHRNIAYIFLMGEGGVIFFNNIGDF